MSQICTNCLYVNNGKFESVKASLIGGLSFIGWGIVFFGVPILNTYGLSIAFSTVFIVIGIVSLWNYFNRGSNVCPKCKHKSIIPTYEPDAQKLIEEKGIMVKDDSTMFCTNCHYKGKPKKIESMKYSLLILLVGILSIPISLIFNPLGLIGVFILLGTGIYGTFTNFRKPNTCPSCNQIAMIPIESDEAKSLIKQDHSESSNISPDQTKAPTT